MRGDLMKRVVVVVVALLASPLAAQQVAVDSTRDAFSRTSRVWITSALLPTGLPGLETYAAARILIGPSDDPSYPYAVDCAAWAGLRQAAGGEYWQGSRVPVELLIRKGAAASGQRPPATREKTVTVPCRERPGDAVFRLTAQRQAAMGITAQLHGEGGTATMVEFPPEFFDALQAVLARADSSLVAASKANRTSLICR
jgi:hypothetical protein